MSLNVDIFFGSQSDKAVYEKLQAAVTGIEVSHQLQVYSAHRNPDQVRELVKSSQADLFIAGAGLSAHLPGCVAAHSLKPVIGLPCNDVMKGLDALIASMQIPGGVPVLACGVENIEAITAFLETYKNIRTKTPTIGVYAPDSAKPWLDIFNALLAPFPFSLAPAQNTAIQSDVAVYFVNLLEPELTPISRKDGICIPYLPEDKPWDPRLLLDLTAQGGLWVGINTSKNAALALIQLWNTQHQWDNDLLQNRGGAPVHA